MITRLRFLLIVCIVAVFCFPLTGVMADGQDNIYITTGRHQITDQDALGAKKIAVADALEKAVQLAFSSVVSEETG